VEASTEAKEFGRYRADDGDCVMSSLTPTDKLYLEELLGMHGGYVLDFTNATFGELFEQYGIDIHGPKYQINGPSKAKKLRAFWASESDPLVGKALSGMLDAYEIKCEIKDEEPNKRLLKKARRIVRRLTGQSSATEAESMEEFLSQEFVIPSIQKMPIDAQVVSLVEERLKEARVTLEAGAYLSVIFMCGSVLEAVLLGAAQRDPKTFNQANAAPKATNGSPKPFHSWNLAQLINVACEVGVLKPDIKEFSHGLREFRNYIHPYQQMASRFAPDHHTAKVCFQVLKAALASLAGERP